MFVMPTTITNIILLSKYVRTVGSVSLERTMPVQRYRTRVLDVHIFSKFS
jgi:hypothetical protein